MVTPCGGSRSDKRQVSRICSQGLLDVIFQQGWECHLLKSSSLNNNVWIPRRSPVHLGLGLWNKKRH
ncbi:hypothetical protein XENTR_v10012302 [Xenopus tropicalis]|nr:hypothetical protein XENTR_v10012302 [Xenopus tropicalis]